MKKEFNQIAKLGKKHAEIKKFTDSPQTIGSHMQKLAEEFGELAQGVNKLSDLKSLKSNETVDDVLANVKEEVADCIQLCFIIAYLAGWSYKDVKKELGKKNKSYKRFIDKLQSSDQKVSKHLKKLIIELFEKMEQDRVITVNKAHKKYIDNL